MNQLVIESPSLARFLHNLTLDDALFQGFVECRESALEDLNLDASEREYLLTTPIEQLASEMKNIEQLAFGNCELDPNMGSLDMSGKVGCCATEPSMGGTIGFSVKEPNMGGASEPNMGGAPKPIAIRPKSD